MVEVGLAWVFVGAPIIAAGAVMLLYIAWTEYRYRKEMDEIEKERTGWRR